MENKGTVWLEKRNCVVGKEEYCLERKGTVFGKQRGTIFGKELFLEKRNYVFRRGTVFEDAFFHLLKP